MEAVCVAEVGPSLASDGICGLVHGVTVKCEAVLGLDVDVGAGVLSAPAVSLLDLEVLDGRVLHQTRHSRRRGTDLVTRPPVQLSLSLTSVGAGVTGHSRAGILLRVGGGHPVTFVTSAVSAASALTLPTSLAINLKTNKSDLKTLLIVTILNESYFLVLDGRTAAVGAEDMASD